MDNLLARLKKIDRQSYSAYKAIKGIYNYGFFSLSIDHVQGDPFATPSRISITIRKDTTGFHHDAWKSVSRKTGFEDFIARAVRKSCQRFAKGARGSGKGGQISIACSHQQVLKRNSVQVHKEFIEARLTLGLPANGRRISSSDALEMFSVELPKIIEHSLLSINTDLGQLEKHLNTVEDQQFLRSWIIENNYVAFVANESVLPRRSGVDDRPLPTDCIKFKSPQSLMVSVELPNHGTIKGMAIPQGITLIVGGGFHGKSTVLNALELGVYDHIPNDGRERIVTDPGAVKIRAEDGRAVFDDDISCFIDHLPLGKDTRHFSSENASGSTSQAANIIEAITAGSKLLLIDEDTSASNFMIRDEKMQALVADDKEPITPLVFRIRDLYEKHRISSIIVMGGSGDYFSVADQIIMLDEYKVLDVTDRAKAIAAQYPPLKYPSSVASFIQTTPRKPNKRFLSARRGKHDFKFDVRNIHALRYGEHDVDLSSVEQLIDSGQTQSIAWLIKAYVDLAYDNYDDVVAGIDVIMGKLNQQGLDFLLDYKIGSLAVPRKYEVLAAINRIRANV